MFKSLRLASGITAGVLLAASASATTFTFSFTGANETATANTALDYSATVSGTTLDLDAYGAHMVDGATSVSSVKYTTAETWKNYGMGVMYTGDSTRNGTHQIDNVGNGVDFVILSFSEAVTLDAINRVAWGISGVGANSDASYLAYAGSATAISSLDTKSFTYLPQGSTALNTDIYSTVWLVAADVNGSTDGFKLTSITASTAPAAVPEAATWAMMVAGFGAIGGALRRRRTPQGLTFVA